MGQLPSSGTGGPSADVSLVGRIAGGDGRALEELYDRYSQRVFALASSITGDTGHAEQAVTQVFLTLWRDPGRFDPGRDGFASWVLAAVHDRSVDVVRRDDTLRRRRAQLAEDAEAYVVGGPDPPGPNGVPWPGQPAEQVRTALRRLPDDQREALVLAYYAGYTQREIATLTETPLGTVKTRMLAGMRRLHALLDGADTTEGVGR